MICNFCVEIIDPLPFVEAMIFQPILPAKVYAPYKDEVVPGTLAAWLI